MNCVILFAMITGVFYRPLIGHGEEITDKSDVITSEEESTSSKSVGTEGMVPIYGNEVKDGTYAVEVETSSSMFRIVKAELTVADGNMNAVITLSGTGYLKLYMGTGEQAVEAEEVDYAAFVEDSEGAYTYTIPVEALDKALECTSFSKRKETWYDHQILFQASSLPTDALLIDLLSQTTDAELFPAQMDVKDGDYKMEVSLAGGSGKTKILSPAPVMVSGKTGIASIQWSSSSYDYMIVNGEKYLPVNKEGNSIFEIPILVLDQEMAVIANTTAMNKPHEIEYTLTFHSETLKKEGSILPMVLVSGIAVCVITVGIVVVINKRKKNHNAQK